MTSLAFILLLDRTENTARLHTGTCGCQDIAALDRRGHHPPPGMRPVRFTARSVADALRSPEAIGFARQGTRLKLGRCLQPRPAA